MKKPAWIILGATSIIAEQFAHIAAQHGHDLILIGREPSQLQIIATDLRLRYRVHCDIIPMNFSEPLTTLNPLLNNPQKKVYLFIAHCFILNNSDVTDDALSSMVAINITSTLQFIHTYWHNQQKERRLVFLSSVAACRGRSKNSLYGASKAMIEIYLEGLQQNQSPSEHISIARLGYIDTRQTHELPGIFYASSPLACATACWQAIHKGKRRFYHPAFWRYIMFIMRQLPFFIYKKLNKW